MIIKLLVIIFESMYLRTRRTIISSYFNSNELIKKHILLTSLAHSSLLIRIHPDIHPDPLSQTPLGWVSLTLILIEIKRKIHHQSNFSRGPNAAIGQLIQNKIYLSNFMLYFLSFFTAMKLFVSLL